MHLAFSWSGLPDYAARCIRSVIDRYPGQVSVIGTHPTVPIMGMEDSLGQAVHWIDGSDDHLTWDTLALSNPDLFFQGGYFWPAFRKLGATCRAEGGKVIGLSDASWQGTLRQRLIDPVRHRLLIRQCFDGWFVPGLSGLRHARAMGYNTALTLPGLLGSDENLFGGGLPTSKRPKRILFAGTLDDNKYVLGACHAFKKFYSNNTDWELFVCGSGPLENEIPNHPGIKFLGFRQPKDLSEIMQRSRILLLPSISEAWGLVVHEAALSGCALAISSSVGSRDDFCTSDNAVVFETGSVRAIELALHTLAAWEDAQWDKAGEISRKRGQHFGPRHFADAVEQFIDIFNLRSH